MKKIVLPPTEGGYYMFGELPQLVAEALHPDGMYPDDEYLSAIVWRDDGTEHGGFFKCIPSPGLHAVSLTSLDGWTVTPVTKEDEAEDPDAGEWLRLRQSAEDSDRLADGSVLILAELKTQRELIQVAQIIRERAWYGKRMRDDARRGPDDPSRLCVVDDNLNGLTFTHGAALDRGWVHIDRLNQWGATLETVNVFSMGDAQQEAQAEPQSQETTYQRRHRWLVEHDECGSVQRVFEKERTRNPSADRPTIGKQIKKARKERDEARREQSTPTQPVTSKKANPFSAWGVAHEDD